MAMRTANLKHCARPHVSRYSTVVGTVGWPPGLHIFDAFGAPTSTTASRVVSGARDLIAAVDAAAQGDVGGRRSATIPQPVRSKAHNLAVERDFVPLRVPDPAAGGNALRRCEHFAQYGSRYHALTYFRGNENIPRVVDPILEALRGLEVIKALSRGDAAAAGGGDLLGLHWKLTLNHYKARTSTMDDSKALQEAGGALFPWHTDLATNGEVTAIATLLAPATIELAPHAEQGAGDTPTRVTATLGSLVLLSGAARWEWVRRAVPHPDAAGKERISLVFGCLARDGGLAA